VKRLSQYADFLSDWITAKRNINLHYLIFTYSYYTWHWSL